MNIAMTQVDRLLAEIPYCQAHPGVSLAQVATQFDITTDQVMQDLKLAWTCELPGRTYGELIDLDLEALEDEGVVYISNVDTLDRPLRMTATEAASLQLALSVIADIASPKLAEVIGGLQDKIAAAGAGMRPIADVRVASGSPKILDALSQAISSAQRVVLTYDGGVRDTTTQPLIDPAQVTVRDGVAYLLAYAIDRGAWRTYRVDRIVDVTPTGESASSHGSPDLDSWAKNLQSGQDVDLVCTPQAAQIAEVYSTKRTQRDDGLIDLTIPVVNPAWIVRLLLRLGSGVLSVEPAIFIQQAREEARHALEAYDALNEAYITSF